MADSFSTEWIKVSEPHPHVYLVELRRKPVNAFSEQFWRSFGKVFDDLRASSTADVRCAVLASALDKMFTAGLDIKSAASVLSTEGSTDSARAAHDVHDYIRTFQAAIRATERCHFPVIAALHGHVIGLGVDIASMCDVRYAAADASFSIKEVDVGLAADIGTLAYLPKITGNQSLARELAYSTRPFSAQEALQLGLVSRVVPGSRAEVISAALDLAKTIVEKSPVAVSGTKRLLNHARDNSVDVSLDYTVIWNSAMLQTKDIAESLVSKQTKRAPQFAPMNKKAKL
ncbi:ClpP/crotonase-like domain-containing protein [Schizophyllum amplum]|uniref:ClpP/crotonase-like domain-containing protein n=1 Tax=Schizophyllum amplum TaxID=97359 RepID=A0A550D001_9AGAR|nr:ClpP/crotonase-like domain-containing protein [Auriculariopsis ampla]